MQANAWLQSREPQGSERQVKTKSMLPVFWILNKKAWVTAKVFDDWFENSFIHEVKGYLAKKNLTFKVLLILDNAPGHPSSLTECHPNVKVIFLPPNTTSLLQGVIATFKSYYTRRNFAHILSIMERDSALTVSDCWKSFNIFDVIVISKHA